MIRKAAVKDIDNINHLYQHYSLDPGKLNNPQYTAKVQKNGFLIALENKQDLSDRIKNNFLFNVYEEKDQVLGYINVNKEIYFPENADNIIWFDQELKKLYFHSPDSIVLHEIIVDNKHQKKGIGKKLLFHSQSQLIKSRIHHLFSIVTIAPVTNCPSLIFHTNNDFARACVTMPIDLFGLKNYQSVLFYKQLK